MDRNKESSTPSLSNPGPQVFQEFGWEKHVRGEAFRAPDRQATGHRTQTSGRVTTALLLKKSSETKLKVSLF